jgi:predicted site-specific integrase-resolvase
MISATKFAKKMGVHTNTVYNWVRKGMPCIKTKKIIFINYDEAIEWLKNNKKFY